MKRRAAALSAFILHRGAKAEQNSDQMDRRCVRPESGAESRGVQQDPRIADASFIKAEPNSQDGGRRTEDKRGFPPLKGREASIEGASP